jgi:hypothetical protein
LSTAGQAFPCALLQDVLPPLARLGTDCAFVGDADWVDSPLDTRGGVAGTFTGVDLDALVTEQFPHQLSGPGVVRIERASVARGKLVELLGVLESENGTISNSLVEAARDHLQLAVGSGHQADLAATGFERLALAFRLDHRELRITGMADAGTLLENAAGPILISQGRAVPAVEVLRTLLPDNQYQVPATRQTAALVGLLPVPDFAPTRTSRLPAHTPTRLGEGGPPGDASVLRQPGLR